MKISALLISTVMLATLLVGCGSSASTSSSAEPAKAAVSSSSTSSTTAPKTDAVASASLTKDPAVFAKSIGKDGKWIICTTADVNVDKELVLEGDFKNGKKDTAGKELMQRKIGLYTQDDAKKVTARFTLTAPKLTIKSPVATIEHGTFKGDLYVETADFKLIDTKVDGNIYFKDDAAKTGFKMDATSSVTGKQEVKK